MINSLEQTLNELKPINDNIFNVINEELAKFETSKYSVCSLMLVSYNLAHRFATLIQSTNLFIDEFRTNPAVEFQIGLLLRPALLDVISYIYLIDKFEKMPDDGAKHDWSGVNKNVEGLLSENLIFYKNEIDLFFGVGYVKQEQYKNVKENIADVSQLVFGCNIFENKKNNEFPRTRDLFNDLDKRKYKKYLLAYYNYSYYSKYEHFGLLSEVMKGTYFDSHEDKVDRYMQSVYFLCETMKLQLTFLRLDTSEINNVIRDLNSLKKDE